MANTLSLLILIGLGVYATIQSWLAGDVSVFIAATILLIAVVAIAVYQFIQYRKGPS